MIEKKIQATKTLHIRFNGRSADFITSNFIYGCAGGCQNSYCYVMRNNSKTIFINSNIDEIISKISQHAETLPVKFANQTDDLY